MTNRPRRVALALVAVLCATTGLSACNDQEGSDVTSVTGTCAMDSKQYDALSPLSAAQLEALLGEGDYRVTGTVRPGAGDVPEGGECSYSRGDDRDVLLELGINRKTDLFRTYDEARALEKTDQARAIDGLDGYIVADPGSSDHGPLAVVFGPDHQVVTLHVVIPSKDAPEDAALGGAAKAAAGKLAQPMRKG